MTQEDKELLLKDLSGRLPYGVIMTNIELCETHYPLTCEDLHDAMYEEDWDDVPYLRPISSMTEEEKKELKCLFDAKNITNDSICFLEGGTLEEYEAKIPFSFCSKLIDWLNAHHFDYRNLIEKGLAIKVTEKNNPYKE